MNTSTSTASLLTYHDHPQYPWVYKQLFAITPGFFTLFIYSRDVYTRHGGRPPTAARRLLVRYLERTGADGFLAVNRLATAELGRPVKRRRTGTGNTALRPTALTIHSSEPGRTLVVT